MFPRDVIYGGLLELAQDHLALQHGQRMRQSCWMQCDLHHILRDPPGRMILLLFAYRLQYLHVSQQQTVQLQHPMTTNVSIGAAD